MEELYLSWILKGQRSLPGLLTKHIPGGEAAVNLSRRAALSSGDGERVGSRPRLLEGRGCGQSRVCSPLHPRAGSPGPVVGAQ